MIEATEVALNWADLLATAALAGGLVYAALVAAPAGRGRAVLWAAMVILALVLGAELLLNAWRMSRISGIGGMALVEDVLAMRWTRLWMARVGALGVFGVVLGAGRGAAPSPVAALALGWLALRSLQGHAGAHGAPLVLADWAHLSAGSVWLGALGQFVAADGRCSAPALRRLRWLATSAVAVLVPSGAYGALLHLPSLAALGNSGYGRTLLAKLMLAAPLLAISAVNHFRLSTRALEGDPAGSTRLERAVRIELVLGGLVLGASALLGSLPMPHSS